MASLEKLAIRGIRSFSPEEEQTIAFYTPMTMILGQNGSGKTTIIECLKYATTGKLPGGGASSGQSWVHDPKLTNDSEVKACVKLRLMQRDGKRMVVVRSMQLQYKGKSKTPTFKQLDGVIKTLDPITKKAENMSHKCQDLNTYVPMVTGISAAILDSVVFCHQEESSWPLQDGSTLKKKFDDIFESSRYTKALEAIEKCRKMHLEEAKNHKIELAGLTERREAAKGIMRELEAKRREVEDLQSKLQDAEERIGGMEKRREEAQKASRELNDLLTQLDRKRLLLQEKRSGVADKKASLETEMLESDEELEERLQSFAAKQESAQASLQRLLHKESVAKKQVDHARALLTKATGERGQLTAKIEQLMGLVAERNDEMVDLCEKYQLTVPRALIGNANKTAELAESETQRFVRELQGKRGELEKQLSDFRVDMNAQSEARRNKIAEVDAKRRTLQHTRAAKAQEAKDVEARLTQAAAERASHNKIPASALEAMDREIETLRKEMEELRKLTQDKRFEDECAKLHMAKTTLRNSIEKEEGAYDSLRGAANTANDLRNAEERAAVRLEDLRTKCMAFNDGYQSRLGDVEVTEAEQSIDDLYAHYFNVRLPEEEAACSEAEARLGEAKHNKSGLEGNLRRDKDELAKLTADMTAMSDRSSLTEEAKDAELQLVQAKVIEEHDDPDAALEKVVTAMVDLTKRQHEKAGRHKAMDELLEEAEAGKDRNGGSRCPCCEKDLNKTEYERFKRVVGTKAQAMRGRAEKDQGKFTKLTDLRDKYRRNVEVLRPLSALRAKERTLQQLIDKEEQQLSELTDEVDLLETNVCELQEKLKTTKEMVGELKNLRALRHECNALAEAVEAQRTNLRTATGDENRTQDQVEAELKRLRAELDETNRVLDLTRSEQAKVQTKLTRATERVRDAEKRKDDKLKSIERLRELDEERARLKQRQGELASETQALNTETLALDDELRTLRTELERTKKKLDDDEAKLHAAQLECVQRLNGFSTKQRRLKDAEAENFKAKLAKTDQDIQTLHQDINSAEGQVEGLAPQIAAARKELEDKDRLRKQIEENVAYRRMLGEIEEQEKEMSILEARAGKFPDSRQLVLNVQNADRQWREGREEKARLEAKVDTLQKLKREQELKLKSETYRDVDKKFKVTKIKGDTTDMVVQDLARYYKALDRALMQYHSMKVEEINKIIRELWTRTYRGNDIEDIAIVSGEDGATGRATKSYNYRVVMKKNGTILDMRNRCSAGQRVLASIVIRLALAETFCVNCGVMTLDEPTTNLDYDNKNGLAEALARLICERGNRQRNFQLVVITHDEDFVHMMKTALSTMPSAPTLPEHYWRVSRQQAGTSGKTYSQIDQVDWGVA